MYRKEVRMSHETIRTHVILPKDLLQAVDELVGKRERSKFLADAAAEKIARAKLARVAQSVAGSLDGVAIPGWESSESAAEWVRASRRADDAHLQTLQTQ